MLENCLGLIFLNATFLKIYSDTLVMTLTSKKYLFAIKH